jgi:MFS family permease
MPLRLFRSTTLNAANAIGILWSAAMFAWFFLSALYLQRVLGCTAMQVGLAFLPSNVIMAACSLGLSARVVARFGLRRPLVFGLLCAAAGLALFARAPVDGRIVVDVLPGMLLLGLGAGIAFNPLLLAAMSDVDESESGLASGIVNTSFMMGGALGLAVLASLAALYTGAGGAGTGSDIAALNAGYRLAFGVGAACALLAAAVGAWLLPKHVVAPSGPPARAGRADQAT